MLSDTDPAASGKAQRSTAIRIEVELFIPVHDNEGHAFDAEHDTVFTVHLVNLFGGFTVLPGEGSGGWKGNDGTIYREPMRLFMVSVNGLVVDGAALRFAAQFAKQHYRQEAIYLRYLGIAEVL